MEDPDYDWELIQPILAAKILMDLIVLIVAYITTKADPTDRTVRLQRYCELENLNFD